MEKENLPVGFRLDINGLRAWAVLAVVFYHFGVAGFSGGFSGVDVFFVISGYLMAGIVVGGLRDGKFSLLDFYLSRARRIVPALLVVVAVVLVVGWFLLMPHDYQMLGRHARESVFFMSNLRFMDEAGYFDSAANTKWLLHTWSLSVEWQFYLIYPLILLMVYRFVKSMRGLLYLHILFLLISFGISVYLSHYNPARAFFWLPSRAWELLLGGAVYFSSGVFSLSLMQRKILALVGLALILASLFGVNSSLAWPGIWAAPAVIGAGFVILASDQKAWVTSSMPMQWVGERSYSLYLWHWPVVVLLAYLGLEQRVEWVVLGMLLSLVLSHLSFHLVEMPARIYLSRLSLRKAVAFIFIAVIVVAAISQVVRRSGIPMRLPEEVLAVEQERNNRNPRQDECLDDKARCVFGGPQIKAYVLGDSHADAVVTGFASALSNPEDGVAFRGTSGCLFVLNARRMDGGGSGCETLRRDVLQEVSNLERKVPVVLINRTTVYALGHTVGAEAGRPLVYFGDKSEHVSDKFLHEFSASYLESVCAFSKVAPVYLVRPFPEMSVHVPRHMGRELLVHGRKADVRITLEEYRARHAFVLALQERAVNQCGVSLLDPLPYLCDKEYCYGSERGLPLYVDDDHLSERGNAKLIPMFRKVFAE